MSSRLSRALFGLSVLTAASVTAAPADAAGPGDQVFDAVNGYEAKLENSQNIYHRVFAVTGILHGQAAEQTLTYQFFDGDTGDRFAPTCERFALIAMKNAGHFAFVVVTDPSGTPNSVIGCRLERR
jgi:hypothetical protein